MSGTLQKRHPRHSALHSLDHSLPVRSNRYLQHNIRVQHLHMTTSKARIYRQKICSYLQCKPSVADFISSRAYSWHCCATSALLFSTAQLPWTTFSCCSSAFIRSRQICSCSVLLVAKGRAPKLDEEEAAASSAGPYTYSKYNNTQSRKSKNENRRHPSSARGLFSSATQEKILGQHFNFIQD